MQLEWQGIMASPQIEDGHLKIANDLLLAFTERRFTASQYRTLLSIMFLTYGAGKKTAKMSIHDIRYLSGERSNQVTAAITQLNEWNVITVQATRDGGNVVGIQKDYERWLSPPLTDKKASKITQNYINGSSSVNTSNTRGVWGDEKSGGDKLLAEVQRVLDRTFTATVWRVERRKAKELYTALLQRRKDPDEVMSLLLDCLAYLDNPNFRAGVTFPVSVLATAFPNWYKQLPPKPRSIREQEEITGHRFRYDIRKGQWVMV